MIEVRYEGLRELLQALRVVQRDLYEAVRVALEEAGGLINRDAARRFVAYGSTPNDYHPYPSRKRIAGFEHAAGGYKTLVRPNTTAMPLVTAGQTLRHTTIEARRRPNFGDLMMRKSLLPARSALIDEAATMIEDTVGGLLAREGF